MSSTKDEKKVKPLSEASWSLQGWFQYCCSREREPSLTIDPKRVPLLQSEKEKRINLCSDHLRQRLRDVCTHIESKFHKAPTTTAVDNMNHHPTFNKRLLLTYTAQCVTIEINEYKASVVSSLSKVQCLATNQILSPSQCVQVKFTLKDNVVKQDIIVCKEFGDALWMVFFWIRIPSRCALLAYDLTRWTPRLSHEQILCHHSVVSFFREVDEC